jgi:serine/threonine protein kinase
MKQYFIPPVVLNCIFYQLLHGFRTLLSKGFLPFPLFSKHILLNTNSIITISNLENLITLKDLSSFQITSLFNDEVLFIAPPELLLTKCSDSEKAAVWIAGMLIIELLIGGELIKPAVISIYGVLVEMFKIFGGPTDEFVKKASNSLIVSIAKLPRSHQVTIQEVLENRIAPIYHYIIDLLIRMTQIDFHDRLTIKNVLKENVLESAKNNMSSIRLPYPECPFFEPVTLRKQYGSIDMDKVISAPPQADDDDKD